MTPRRLTFQLTPLLDLLLIVIFAQYMEVQQKAESAQAALTDQKQQLDEHFQTRLTRLEAEFDSKRQALETDLQSERNLLETRRQRYSEHYESLLKQHQQAGAALAEAFNLPGTVVEQILKLSNENGPDRTAALEQAAQQLKQTLESRGNEMLDFVLRYDEMQKHVSVWELYIQDNGQALFSDGQLTTLISFASTEEFVARAFEASKSFTEPKPLVIVLLSWGSPHAVQRQRATDGMPPMMEQLRRDSGNTRWFDFSLLGYHASGPIFPAAENATGKETPVPEAP